MYCGKYIQRDLGKHIAFYHMELAQLWCCPVMWCKVWKKKGTAQDCIDHMRRTHKVPLSVKAANLAKFFPPWTVTREQWADMMIPSISGVLIDTLLFSRIGSPLCHRYRIISQTGSHVAFRGRYIHRLRAFLEESDSTVVRRLHRQLAQELARRISLPPDSPASVSSRSAVGHRTVSRSRRPRRLKGVTDSSGRPELGCRLQAVVSSVQALMDLSLPQFAGLGDGPRLIHPPWSIASDLPASPATAQLETSSEEGSRCSVSSACLNLDLLSSSSEDDSKDLAERSDLSITLFDDSDETCTPVNSDQVFSDGDFPAESVPKDKRQVVRRCASPPGGQIMRVAHDDREYEPPLPVIDLVTGKCRPGKVSRTVSRTPLMLDLTVVCTSGAVVPPPGVTSKTLVPPVTVASEGIDVGMSVPVVVTPVPVVEQPSSPVGERVSVVEFLQPLLSENPELLQEVVAATALPSSPLSGWSSSSSSSMLPWGAADDSLPPFLPNRVQAGHSQDVPDEGSLFNVSPLWPGLLFRPSRGGQSHPAEGVLLPTTLDDFDDTVLGDPITYACCEQFPGSESPLLCLCMCGHLVLLSC